MATENNSIRLAEIQQYQQRKKHAPLGSQTSDLLGSTSEQPSKLRRLSSLPIFPSNPAENKKKKTTSKTQKKQKKGRAKKTNNKKGKKGSKNKRRVKEARVRKAEMDKSATAQQGQDEKQKQQQEQNQEQQQQVAQPPAAPKQQQQQAAQKQLEPMQQHKAPEVKQEPHEAAESKQPIVPVATPARSNLPTPAVAGKLVHDMLNRTATQDQLQQTPQAPGKPEPAQPPQSKTPVEAEPRPAKKGRDPVRHARKQKFYRSLESQTLNKNTYDFTNGLVISTLSSTAIRWAFPMLHYGYSMLCLQSVLGPKQLQVWKLHSHLCWPTQARIHLKLWRNLPDVPVKDIMQTTYMSNCWSWTCFL